MSLHLACLIALLAVSRPIAGQAKKAPPKPPVQPAQSKPAAVVRIRVDTIRQTVHDTVRVEKPDSVTDWWLVGLAGAAFVVAFAQALYFRKQLNLMSTQLDQANTQIKQTRAEYVATHRPRLTIRGVIIKSDSDIERLSQQERNVLQQEIQFTIVNTGGTPATIISVETTNVLRSSPIRRELEPKEWDSHLPLGAAEVLQPGGFLTLIARSQNFNAMYVPTDQIRFFSGLIHYCDENNVPRQTGFLRQLHERQLTIPHNPNPDFEFTD